MEFELTPEYIEKLKEAVAAGNDIFIRDEMEELHAVDISSILDWLDTDQSKYILGLLTRQEGAEIIMHLDEDYRKKLLHELPVDELAAYFNYIDSDDAADILNAQPIKRREELIPLIPNEEKAKYIRDLLHYEEDCAGGLMAKELVKANINWTVNQCIDEIRRQSKAVEKIYSVYVVDNNDKLLGIVPLKKLLLSDEQILVADIFESDIISVETYMEGDEVARVMQKYDLESVPVVNVHGKLLGRITIDDVIDVITEQAEIERQLMAGISELPEEDASVWRMSRSRLPWLLIGMGGGMLGATFMGFFESNIKIIPAMAFFIPLITATGGNVGIQSSSIVVQSLANRDAFNSFNTGRLFKGFIVALINGLAISSIVFGFNMMIGQEAKLSIVVSIALLSVVVLASFFGTVTPIILDKSGVNPALASGPFITTVNDLLGLAIYFMVAHALLTF
jgi:magnesium transporter